MDELPNSNNINDKIYNKILKLMVIYNDELGFDIVNIINSIRILNIYLSKIKNIKNKHTISIAIAIICLSSKYCIYDYVSLYLYSDTLKMSINVNEIMKIQNNILYNLEGIIYRLKYDYPNFDESKNQLNKILVNKEILRGPEKNLHDELYNLN